MRTMVPVRDPPPHDDGRHAAEIELSMSRRTILHSHLVDHSFRFLFITAGQALVELMSVTTPGLDQRSMLGLSRYYIGGTFAFSTLFLDLYIWFLGNLGGYVC